MYDQFTKPFSEFFKTQLPEQLQTMAHDGLAKSRDVALQSIAVAKDGAEAFGKACPVAPKEASALTAKAFAQVIENTESAYEVAQSIARAKSPVEVAQLQAKYMQNQFSRAGEQAKELFELSTKLAQSTGDGMGQLAAKSGVAFKAK